MDKKSKVDLAHLALAFDLPTTVITLHADNGASRTPTVSHSWLWRGNVIVLAQRYLLDLGYTTSASAIAQETNVCGGGRTSPVWFPFPRSTFDSVAEPFVDPSLFHPKGS